MRDQKSIELIMELLQETDNPETLRFVYVYLLVHKQRVQKLKEEVRKQYDVKGEKRDIKQNL